MRIAVALLALLPMAAISGVDTAYAAGIAVSEARDARLPRRTTGSAFFLGSGGHLVTNAHVVAGCEDPHLVIGGLAEPIQVVLIDTNIDIAILRSRSDVNRTGFNLSTNAKLGQHVTVFGFPLSPSYAQQGRATTGVVLGGSKDGQRLMTNAQVQAGNSGGPIIDQAGAVVGVAFGKNVNRTFAVSATAVGEVFAKLDLSAPLSQDTSVLTVAEVIDKARRLTGKVDCRR